MTASTEITALLKEMGLTETESEVYLTLLQTARGEAVSSYRVAQEMGRDPANLGKILSALSRRGAVRVVQEKPRLFAPVSPDEFTGQILERLAATQRRTVELLRRYESTPASGTALALTGPDQVLERARLLLGRCQRRAALYADAGICSHLRAFLESVAERPGAEVLVLGPDTEGLPAAVRIDGPGGDAPWIQLTVDDEFWLVARLREDGTLQAPSGWWGEDAGLAQVLAATLAAAVRQGVAPSAPAWEPEPMDWSDPEPEPQPDPEPEPAAFAEPDPEPVPVEEPDPQPEPTPTPVEEPEPEPEPVQEPEPEPAPPADPPVPGVPDDPNGEDDPNDEDDGIEFIIRHDQDR